MLSKGGDGIGENNKRRDEREMEPDRGMDPVCVNWWAVSIWNQEGNKMGNE